MGAVLFRPDELIVYALFAHCTLQYNLARCTYTVNVEDIAPNSFFGFNALVESDIMASMFSYIIRRLSGHLSPI